MTKHPEESERASTEPAQVPLDSTGVPGLDEVLGGGIQRGSLTIIAGPPGGGKTILAHHIAFSAAHAGRRTTVLTAFSEPTNKLIAHMRPFAFFDQDIIGQTLDVLSIQQLLRQGMDTAADEIVGAVRAARAELVILDGFRGVRETTEHPDEARRFIYDVSNRLSLFGATLLLTSEAYVRDVTFFPEATTADVLLGLEFEVIGARERRTLEVLKARGASPLTGRHAMTIGDEGVTIYPRLEARVARQAGINRPYAARRASSADSGTASEARGTTPPGVPAPDATSPRAGSGIPGLDLLLDGSLTPGASTVVIGERGVGKTLFGLQFALAAVRAGERSVFAGFHETADQLARKSAPFAWGAELADALASGALTVLRTSPVELRADVLAENILALLDETQPPRFVLDEIGELKCALTTSGYPERFRDFVAALLETLRRRGITTLLTDQVELATRSGQAPEPSYGPAVTLAANLLWLRRKLRGARFDRSLVVMHTEVPTQLSARYPVIIQPPDGLTVSHHDTEPDEGGKHARDRESEERRDDQR